MAGMTHAQRNQMNYQDPAFQNFGPPPVPNDQSNPNAYPKFWAPPTHYYVPTQQQYPYPMHYRPAPNIPTLNYSHSAPPPGHNPAPYYNPPQAVNYGLPSGPLPQQGCPPSQPLNHDNQQYTFPGLRPPPGTRPPPPQSVPHSSKLQRNKAETKVHEIHKAPSSSDQNDVALPFHDNTMGSFVANKPFPQLLYEAQHHLSLNPVKSDGTDISEKGNRDTPSSSNSRGVKPELLSQVSDSGKSFFMPTHTPTDGDRTTNRNSMQSKPPCHDNRRKHFPFKNENPTFPPSKMETTQALHTPQLQDALHHTAKLGPAHMQCHPSHEPTPDRTPSSASSSGPQEETIGSALQTLRSLSEHKSGVSSPKTPAPGLTAPGLTAPGLPAPGLPAPGLPAPPAMFSAPSHDGTAPDTLYGYEGYPLPEPPVYAPRPPPEHELLSTPVRIGAPLVDESVTSPGGVSLSAEREIKLPDVPVPDAPVVKEFEPRLAVKGLMITNNRTLFPTEVPAEAAPVVDTPVFEPLQRQQHQLVTRATAGQWIVKNTRKKRRRKDVPQEEEKSQSSTSIMTPRAKSPPKVLEPETDPAAARRARRRRAKKRKAQKKKREKEEALKKAQAEAEAERLLTEEKAQQVTDEGSEDSCAFCRRLQELIVSCTVPIYAGIFKYSTTPVKRKRFKMKST